MNVVSIIKKGWGFCFESYDDREYHQCYYLYSLNFDVNKLFY